MVGYICTDETHNKFRGFCGQTRYKYDPSLRDKNDNMVHENLQEHMEYMIYECHDSSCNKIYTSILNRQTKVARFFEGDVEPKTFDEATTTFNSNTHFYEKQL